jgi:hypothetical protein
MAETQIANSGDIIQFEGEVVDKVVILLSGKIEQIINGKHLDVIEDYNIIVEPAQFSGSPITTTLRIASDNTEYKFLPLDHSSLSIHSLSNAFGIREKKLLKFALPNLSNVKLEEQKNNNSCPLGQSWVGEYFAESIDYVLDPLLDNKNDVSYDRVFEHQNTKEFVCAAACDSFENIQICFLMNRDGVAKIQKIIMGEVYEDDVQLTSVYLGICAEILLEIELNSKIDLQFNNLNIQGLNVSDNDEILWHWESTLGLDVLLFRSVG